MGSNEPTFSYKKGSSLFCIKIIVLTNSYGHPHEELLERLENAESRVVITKDYGAITMEIGKEVKVYGFAK